MICRNPKARLVFLLIILLITSKTFALSIATLKEIEGSTPYITFDGGVSKITSSGAFISVKLSDNKVISITNDTSSESNPIILPKSTDSFGDIKTNVPIEYYPEIDLNNLVAPHHYWKDDDGDDLISVTGKVSLKWYDVEKRDVTGSVKENPKRRLAACNAPYKLTIETTEGIIQTKYGIPDLSNFTGASHSFYFFPKIEEPYVCYAQPNLAYEQSSGVATNGSTWKAGKGFRVQNLNNPSKNFPTTGSDNLFFKLNIIGATAQQIIEINGSQIRPQPGEGVTLHLQAESDSILRITLNGPKAPNGGKFSASTFYIYSDKAKTKSLYNFTISRWYIPFSGGNNYYKAKSACDDLSKKAGNSTYRLPKVLDLTNSFRGSDWTDGIASEHYAREISYPRVNKDTMGGLFNEWGATINSYYNNTNWERFRITTNNWKYSSFYWTSNEKSSRNGITMYVVEAETGTVGYRERGHVQYHGLCVTP